VKGLCTFDSRTVEPGGLFVVLVGACVDWHDLAHRADAAGVASPLVTCPLGLPSIVVNELYRNWLTSR
jgi:UDP-N-acetylmuramoyl-tripeptide--D-alanyl-D-alanine ligase